ncbi:MAG: DinB family protein [Tepidiformaceae bacterium]
MADKTEAIAELQAAHDRFRARIADLPDAAYGETFLGTWNLSQLLAHMAGWYGEIKGGFERVGRGERPVPEGVDYSDADTWNVKFAANAQPGRAALAQFDAAYAAYAGAAQALAADSYGVDPERGRPKIGNRLLEGAGIHHFGEHTPEVESWLSGRKA